MKKDIVELEKLLFNYLSEIFEFENAIARTYKLGDLPFNMLSHFPMYGSVLYDNKKADYRFHGIGCSLTVNSIEIEFSIYANRANYIALSPWDFLRYIQTVNNNILTKNLTQSQSLQYLELMEKHDVVIKIFENYHVYEINLNWYKNFMPN